MTEAFSPEEVQSGFMNECIRIAKGLGEMDEEVARLTSFIRFIPLYERMMTVNPMFVDCVGPWFGDPDLTSKMVETGEVTEQDCRNAANGLLRLLREKGNGENKYLLLEMCAMLVHSSLLPPRTMEWYREKGEAAYQALQDDPGPDPGWADFLRSMMYKPRAGSTPET